jgi:hypothetical protein
MVDKQKQELVGSASRDIFKRWHKDLGRDLYALDIDLMLIHKTGHSSGGISAVIDFKLARERNAITFTEAIAYKFFIESGIRVFLIVASKVEEEALHIIPPVFAQEITKITDWKTPAWEVGERIDFQTREDFVRWERELRQTSTVDVPRYARQT